MIDEKQKHFAQVIASILDPLGFAVTKETNETLMIFDLRFTESSRSGISLQDNNLIVSLTNIVDGNIESADKMKNYIFNFNKATDNDYDDFIFQLTSLVDELKEASYMKRLEEFTSNIAN